ncbi:putative uncharacterized protein [Bacteroides sp. CAG:702]|nr:putative uncharacterized protein [Bacteroides sp. CAG:702]
MDIIKGGTVTVIFGRKIAPAIFYEVLMLLDIARIHGVCNSSQFLADAHTVAEHPVTIGDRTSGLGRRIIATSFPFASVAGGKLEKERVTFIEDDTEVFSPNSMVLDTECEFHLILLVSLCVKYKELYDNMQMWECVNVGIKKLQQQNTLLELPLV